MVEPKHGVALPDVRPHDLLLRVHSAALNPVDYKIVEGFLGMVEGVLLDAPPARVGECCCC